jgi:hypothetical protein
MPLHTLPQDRVAVGARDASVLADPVTEILHTLALARTIGVAARSGIFGNLAEAPRAVPELAAALAFQPEPLRLMLDVLAGVGLIDYHGATYELSAQGQRWLDPDSPTSITTLLSHTLDHWDWWAGLDDVVAGHGGACPTPDDDDEAAWLRYTRADYETARLVAADVAAAIDLPESSGSVLDLGAGHGRFAAATCLRNPLLRATVIAAAGPVAIGREIMWETGMDQVVTHQVGDIDTAYLGGPYNAVICSPLALGLDAERWQTLLGRVHEAMRPDGVIAVVGAGPITAPGADRPALEAALELFHYVRTGGGAAVSAALPEQLAAAGFREPVAYSLAALPGLSVQVARTI